MSNLPLIVSGSAATTAKADGTMYPGSTDFSSRRAATSSESLVTKLVGNDIGHQPLATRRTGNREHRALVYARPCRHGSLDLAGSTR